MQITTNDPHKPPGMLLAPIHQHHAGLSTISVRRRGAESDLMHAVLDVDEGGVRRPVKHREPPTATPDYIVARLWEAMRDDSAVRGPGTYDVTLAHCPAERGTPPKPVVIAVPVGHVREGVDGSAATALHVAQFCAATLERTLAQLPSLVRATADGIAALQSTAAALSEAQRSASSGSIELDIAKLESQREEKRWEKLTELLAPSLKSLRGRIGERKQLPAATKPSSAATATPAASGAPAATGTGPREQVVELARRIGESIRDDASLSASIAELLGPELHTSVLALATCTDASQALDLLARVTVHPRRVDVLVLLDGAIGDDVERIASLADQC